jgi:hypothetical protein
MKTVMDNGKLYQIGCFYEFKDSINEFWEVGVLCDYENGRFKSKCGNKLEWYNSIMRCTGIMGTVVDAPVKLENGKAYQFFDRCNKQLFGIYNSESNILTVEQGRWFDIEAISDIKPLILEGK